MRFGEKRVEPKGSSRAVLALPPADIDIEPARFIPCAGLAGYFGVVAIIVLSLAPDELKPSIGIARELVHGIAYFIVALLLTVAGLIPWPRVMALIVLAAALQLGQGLVLVGYPDLSDFLVSAAGALLGFGLFLLVAGPPRGEYARDASDHLAAGSAIVRYRLLVAFLAIAPLVVGTSVVAASGTTAWLGAGLALAMLAIAIVDAQHFIIPDPLNAAGLALGLANSAVLERGDWIEAMAGPTLRAAVLVALFFGLRLIYARLRGRAGIGLGDVKLAAVAGVWLDWSVMPIAIEIAALSALSVYALRRYVLRHPLRSGSRLPFGLYFAPAIWIGWLLQITLMQGR